MDNSNHNQQNGMGQQYNPYPQYNYQQYGANQYNANQYNSNQYNANPYNNSNNNNKPQKSKMGVGMLLGALIGVFGMLLLLIFVAGILGGAGMLKIGNNGEIYIQSVNPNDKNGIGTAVEGKLNSLDSLLDRFYFNDVDKEKAADAIFEAYLASYGDIYTVYYTPAEYKTIMESTSGTFCGIGAVCQQNEDGTVLIVDPYDYAPAYKAGIRAGDCVTKIDGTDVTKMTLDGAVALIKGEKGTNVTLEVRRGEELKTFTVTREEIIVQSVKYEMLKDNIGYIEISSFDAATVKQFREAITVLKNQGMKGLVLDVRDNPGGLLNAVVDMVDEVISQGMVVYMEDNQGKREEYKGNSVAELNLPMAVLVNGNSASASEIFAGALQDYDKAEIIGTQTFGKGIVQTIQPLADGSAIKYTVAKYFTPKGQDIHGKGVTPDQVVEIPEDATSDTQLDAAVSFINSKIN